MINIHVSGRRVGEVAFSWSKKKPEPAKTEPQPEPAPAAQPAKTDDDDRPKLTAGSHLASADRSSRVTVWEPDTIGFGFGRQ